MGQSRFAQAFALAVLAAGLLWPVSAEAEVKRWEGMVDAEQGRGLAGHKEFALGCNRRDGFFVMMPLSGGTGGETIATTFVIDGAEFPVENALIVNDEGKLVLVARLTGDQGLITELRRGLKFDVVTQDSRTNVGLYGAAPFIRDMMDACTPS